MIVVEYENDAIVLDCGFSLGLNLPGVNYAIPVTDYLQSIKHKLRGYVISHGHMDHIGALIHTVPQNPAPIYGSRWFTDRGCLAPSINALILNLSWYFRKT